MQPVIPFRDPSRLSRAPLKMMSHNFSIEPRFLVGDLRNYPSGHTKSARGGSVASLPLAVE
jgi:hypothetical protein